MVTEGVEEFQPLELEDRQEDLELPSSTGPPEPSAAPGPPEFGEESQPRPQQRLEVPIPTVKPGEKDDFVPYDENDEPIEDDQPMPDVASLIYHLVHQVSEPNTLKQALKSAESQQWIQASLKELRQLLQKGTFRFIPRSLLKKKPITCRWVLKRKLNQKGQVSKFKARLVTRGFQQVPGVDYTETFASTSIPPTWRILLALAARLDWEIEQIDFVGAFLNGDIEEDLYMDFPPGLEDLLKADSSLKDLLEQYGWNPDQNQVIKVVKALYGLKQSPRQWQTKLRNLLESLDFRPLISDSAVYYSRKWGIFIVSYVDDCLLFGPSMKAISTLKKCLNKAFEIEDLGAAAFFLGVEILRDRQNRTLWITQRQYITAALQHFGLIDAATVSIPLQPGLLSPSQPTKALSWSEIKEFQSLNGTAMYAMLESRPDIAFTVQFLSRHMQQPAKQHLTAAKSQFRYLKGTINYGLRLGGKDESLEPIAYSDSDFAGCKTTAKSTFGYLIYCCGGVTSWKSKRSSTIALSTLEAEYNAITEATREVLWARGLYSEIQRPITGPTPLYSDSQNAISTSKDPKHHGRTKHTLVHFEFVRSKVAEGLLAISYLETSKMPADGLTKPLPAPKFEVFRRLLRLEPLPEDL